MAAIEGAAYGVMVMIACLMIVATAIVTINAVLVIHLWGLMMAQSSYIFSVLMLFVLFNIAWVYGLMHVIGFGD